MQATRLSEHREGLLVDPGAFDNLAGSAWVERMAHLSKLAGHNHKFITLDRPLGVEGVGAGAQEAQKAVIMTGAIKAEGMPVRIAQFEAPVLPNSEVPALWGNRSLRRNRAVLDMVNNRLYLCGPGEIQFTPPPGTQVLALETSPSGHLLLPFSDFGTATTTRPTSSSSSSSRSGQRILRFATVEEDSKESQQHSHSSSS